MESLKQFYKPVTRGTSELLLSEKNITRVALKVDHFFSMLARASELFVRCFSEPGTPLLASYSSTSWTRSAPGERVERLAAQMTQVLVWSTNCSQKWTEWRAEGESSSWVPPIGKDGGQGFGVPRFLGPRLTLIVVRTTLFLLFKGRCRSA